MPACGPRRCPTLRSLQIDDQTPYAPFPVVVHQTRIVRSGKVGASSDAGDVASAIASAVRAVGMPKPAVLHVQWRLLKHRAIGVVTFESFALQLRDLTINLAERYGISGAPTAAGSEGHSLNPSRSFSLPSPLFVRCPDAARSIGWSSWGRCGRWQRRHAPTRRRATAGTATASRSSCAGRGHRRRRCVPALVEHGWGAGRD